MSATEPLAHVKVHGRHLFIPRSLTDSSFSYADRNERDNCRSNRFLSYGYDVEDEEYACDDYDYNGGDAKRHGASKHPSELPTAEERRVLHELLTAVVLSASCSCGALDGSVGSTDFSEETDGVTATFSRSRRTFSSSSSSSSTNADATKSADSPTSSEAASTTAFAKSARLAAPSLTNCNCANAQTVACAVAVVLVSCVLLRTT